MKSLAFIVPFLLSSVAASAQTNGSGSAVGQSAIAPLPSPKSIGRPHTCNGWYPVPALLAEKKGTTTLGFTIEADGIVSNITVQETSGDDDLDEAAVACARYWHYIPATQNSVPIETPWKAKIVWDATRMCAPFYNGPPIDFRSISGTSVLYIDVQESRLARLNLKQSSGNDALDASAQACVATAFGRIRSRHAINEHRTMEIPWKDILQPR